MTCEPGALLQTSRSSMLLAVASLLMSPPDAFASDATVGAIFLRFNGSQDRLESAVRSILTDSTDSACIGEVLLVDNASTENPMAVDTVAARIGDARIRVIRLERNFGFAGGVNRGLASLGANITSVLLMNDDAVLEQGSLTRLLFALRAGDSDLVAVAPKLYLDTFPGIIESCGMVVNGQAEARNCGLGQFDIGQFEEEMQTLGPSFAAGLFKRSAFNTDQVGLLEEDYFLYYEDVEWNWRANLFGFRSVTCPSAVGTHAVSASSRGNRDLEASYAFKHRFIETNLLATAARCLEGQAATNVWFHRFPRLVKGRVTGRFPRASFGAAIDSVCRLRKTLAARRWVQGRRTVGDAAILRFSDSTLPILFDPVTYTPRHTWLALEQTASAAVEACSKRSPNNVESIARFEAIRHAAARKDREACALSFAQPTENLTQRSTELTRAFDQYLERLT